MPRPRSTASRTTCANQGLNIAADLAGTQHFKGRVSQQADGTFQVTGPNGSCWDQGYIWAQGYIWEQGYVWAEGLCLARVTSGPGLHLANLDYDIPWVDGYPADIGSSVASSSPMSINSWVNQE